MSEINPGDVVYVRSAPGTEYLKGLVLSKGTRRVTIGWSGATMSATGSFYVDTQQLVRGSATFVTKDQMAGRTTDTAARLLLWEQHVTFPASWTDHEVIALADAVREIRGIS